MEFSERLAAMLPEPLDTVFLVNSGSEASDLALRLAMAATGTSRCRRGPRGLPRVDVWHRRHFDVGRRQPERACHPARLGAHRGVAQQLPGQVPGCRRRPLRGRRGGPDRGADRRRPRARRVHRRAGVRQCRRHGAAGRYLEQVYAAVRAGGGLAIADEVQVALWPARQLVLGLSNSRTSSPISCRSRNPRATVSRSAR